MDGFNREQEIRPGVHLSRALSENGHHITWSLKLDPIPGVVGTDSLLLCTVPFELIRADPEYGNAIYEACRGLTKRLISTVTKVPPSKISIYRSFD